MGLYNKTETCAHFWTQKQVGNHTIRAAVKKMKYDQEEESASSASSIQAARNTMINICFSGGAVGADMLFGEIAGSAGHEVVHYGFSGMKSMASTHSIKILEETELLQADEPIRQAGIMLGRYPPRKHYVKNLIRRNYFQVNDSERVYAVTRWNLLAEEKNDGASGQPRKTVEGQLGGGTGWAVAMAIALKVPHIFLFAIEKEQWYRYDYDTSSWTKIEESTVPIPSGKYAGIGSRDLGEKGEAAIRCLFVPPTKIDDPEATSTNPTKANPQQRLKTKN